MGTGQGDRALGTQIPRLVVRTDLRPLAGLAVRLDVITCTDLRPATVHAVVAPFLAVRTQDADDVGLRVSVVDEIRLGHDLPYIREVRGEVHMGANFTGVSLNTLDRCIVQVYLV